MLWPWWKLLIWTHNQLCINCTTIVHIDLLITLLESPCWKAQFEFNSLCSSMISYVQVWDESTMLVIISDSIEFCYGMPVTNYTFSVTSDLCSCSYSCKIVPMRETVGPHPSMLWWSQFDSFNTVFGIEILLLKLVIEFTLMISTGVDD